MVTDMRYLLSIILCLTASCALAAIPPWFIGAVASWGGAANYLYAENYEGAGTPPGVIITGSGTRTVDFDSVSAPLMQGGQHLTVTLAASAYSDISSGVIASLPGEVYYAFRIRRDVLPGGFITLATIQSSGGTALARIRSNASGQIGVQGGTASSVYGSTVFPINTDAWLMLRYKSIGSGTSEAQAYYSTDGITFTSQASVANGTVADTPAIFVKSFQSNTIPSVTDIDDERVSSSLIRY